MVLVLNSPFFHLFMLGNIGQKSVFHGIQNRQNAFFGSKIKKFKKWKNRDFFSLQFRSKIGHFSMFLF